MDCKIKWVDNMQFVATTGSRHALVVDASGEVGGQDTGARPMELLLVSAGSCSAIDVKLILERGRHQVTSCEVFVSGERVQTVPAVFHAIHLRYVLAGPKLSRQAVEKAVHLSHEKYCSVTKMLGATVNITHSIELLDV